MQKEIVPGQLVKSIAGRDSGKYFLVIENNGRSVKIVDGEMRKVQVPKNKNVKHLRLFQAVAADIAQKVRSGKGLTNSEVAKAIVDLVNGLEG